VIDRARNAKLGVLGFGSIGEALVRGVLRTGRCAPSSVVISDPDPGRRAVAARLGLTVVTSNVAVASSCKIILLSVKPQTVPRLLGELGAMLTAGHLLISVAAGISTEQLERAFEAPVRVIRVMPNLPCVVGEGVMAMCLGRHATSEDAAAVRELLGSSGKVFQVAEHLMDAVTGFTASGPAFVFLLIEALADAGVRVGFTWDEAVVMAAQTVLGSAKVVLGIEAHPAVLKNKVTSAGGTAIAGLHQLEAAGVRAAIMDAVLTATQRSRELGKGIGGLLARDGDSNPTERVPDEAVSDG